MDAGVKGYMKEVKLCFFVWIVLMSLWIPTCQEAQCWFRDKRALYCQSSVLSRQHTHTHTATHTETLSSDNH